MVSQNEISNLATEARENGIQKMVVGGVIFKEGKVLIVTRSATEDFMAGLEEIPSGTVDAGESLDVALVREVKEEIGLDIKSIDKYVNFFDYISGSGKKSRQFNFIISVEDGEIVLNPDEHSEYKWLDPKSTEFENSNISAHTKNTIKLAARGDVPPQTQKLDQPKP